MTYRLLMHRISAGEKRYRAFKLLYSSPLRVINKGTIMIASFGPPGIILQLVKLSLALGT